MESQKFRKIAGTYPTGVTVIATRNSDGNPVGMTANSFTTLSLNPPLVMFAIDKQASLFQDFMTSNSFSINILSKEQENLSRQFSKKNIDRFEGVEHIESAFTACPILSHSVSYFDCRTVEKHEAGDHIIIVGEVVDGEFSDSDPLIFCKGQYIKQMESRVELK